MLYYKKLKKNSGGWNMRTEAKNKVFPIRISKQEEEFLKCQAEAQKKSMADLIRAGYLDKFKEIKY